jgi:hypothetical protein
MGLVLGNDHGSKLRFPAADGEGHRVSPGFRSHAADSDNHQPTQSRKESTMTATVRLARKGWGSSHSVRARTWKIEIDGILAGSIGNEQTVELPVKSGRHTLRVRSFRYLLSPEQSFDAVDGQVTGFRCHPRSLTPLILTRWTVWLLASLCKHDLWISLKPDVDEARPLTRAGRFWSWKTAA